MPGAGDAGGAAIVLQAPGGQTVDTVVYELTGPAAWMTAGALDVSHGAGAPAVISPLPVGTGYRITLAGATTGDGHCRGSASFDVVAGATARVPVSVDCQPATALQADVQNLVVIYAENRSFDGLFGNFPGAHGYAEASNPQLDRDGTTVLPKLPQTWGGATAVGNPTVITQAQTDNLPNAPFALETGYGAYNPGTPNLTTADVTRDIAHRFFENVMQVNGGTNDMFAAWTDGGGITMGHWDDSAGSLSALARQYVLADNFFQGAYGGSFLNHQYLICACAPAVSAAYVGSHNPSLNVLGAPNAKGVPQLASNAGSPASALTGPPSLQTGNIAPLDYFGAGDGYRAVNTMQPPYQPSGNPPAAGASDLTAADPAAATTLPPQTQITVGDLLSAGGVDWAWYAGAWDAAVADGTQSASAPRTVIYTPGGPRGTPDFQPHHQPYNYYARFDPVSHASERAAHLKDYDQLVSDAAAGTLPPVAWYKPAGGLNQHPGYANVGDADAHIADLVAKLQAGPQWAHMVIVITYDEYGGQWDHVAPPQGDQLGPGTRIPALIVSPYARMGTVDHTAYDSASTLRFISARWGLPELPGVAARDAALVANGGAPMGDLTAALSLP